MSIYTLTIHHKKIKYDTRYDRLDMILDIITDDLIVLIYGLTIFHFEFRMKYFEFGLKYAVVVTCSQICISKNRYFKAKKACYHKKMTLK